MRNARKTAVKKIILWILTFICFEGIFLLSSQPLNASASLSNAVVQKSEESVSQIAPTITQSQRMQRIFTDAFFRDSAHVIIFSLLAFFLTFALKAQKLRKPFMTYLLSAVICVLYGVTDEFYQGFFVYGRSLEFVDMLKDWSGSLGVIFIIAAISYIAIHRKNKKRGIIGG